MIYNKSDLLTPPKNASKYINQYTVFTICLVAYMLCNLLHEGFIPDWLNLKASSPSTVFSLIIGTTSAIFGILVTVVLLVFQLLKKVSLRRKTENIVYNPFVTAFIGLSVFIIVSGTIASITLTDFHTTASVTKGYFILDLFVLFIFLIFPVSVLILRESDNIKKILKIIGQLGVQDFFEMTRAKINEGKIIENEITKPLFTIRHEILNAIRDYDNTDLTTLLEGLNEKAIDLIGDGKNRKTTNIVMEGLINVWKHANTEAVRTGNYQYFNEIWACIGNIYRNAADKKIFLLHLNTLEIYLWEFIHFLSRNKLADNLIVGIPVLSDSFTQNLLNNCPKQQHISELYDIYEKDKVPEYRQDDNMQWDDIIGILRNLQTIHSASLTIPDKELFSSCSRELNRLLTSIVEHMDGEVEPYKEAYIVRDITGYLTYEGSQAHHQALFPDTLETYRFNNSTIARYYQKRNQR